MKGHGEELRRLVALDADLVTEAIGHRMMLERAKGYLGAFALVWCGVFLVGVLTHQPLDRPLLAWVSVLVLAALAWERWLAWAGREFLGRRS